MLTEAEARRILFIRALDEADSDGVLGVSEIIKSHGKTPSDESRPNPEQQLHDLCRQVETRFVRRHRVELASYYSRAAPSWNWLMFALCFLLGLGANYLGATRVNLLLNPFIALVAWNLLVYAVMILARLLPGGAAFRGEMEKLGRGITRFVQHAWFRRSLGGVETAKAKTLAGAKILFLKHWLHAAGRISSLRLAGLLHGLAATLVIGVVAGLYLRGLIQEYDFDWSSTFIREPEARLRFLNILFGPVLFLGQPFFPDGLPALEPGNGAAWIHLYALTAFVYILLPRFILRLIATTKARRMARKIELDLKDPYFLKLTASFKREIRQVVLQSYSFTLEETPKNLLVELIRELWGNQARVGETRNISWGETEPTFPEPGEAKQVWICCFNGVQTPEEEIHGDFAARMLAQATARDHRPELLIIVDHAGVENPLKAKRRQAWERVLQEGGCHRFAWVALSDEVDRDALLKTMVACIWSDPP